MLTIPLEPTDDRANPAFKDPNTCTLWLSKLQFTNLHAVHSLLRNQINELNRYPLRVLDRLNTLEQLRETVATVQADYAKKLVAKKLPFSDEEFSIFNAINELWKGMLTGYQRCMQDYMDGDSQMSKYGAMLCQRFMLYGSLQIIEHLRCGYEFDGKLWQQLHSLYSFCEGNGLQHEKITDPLHGAPKGISCHTMYAKILLTCYAKPSELSRSQLQLLDRWLTQWTDVITIERRCVLSKGDAPPLAVDLQGDQGLQDLEHVTRSDHVRYLAMVPLSKLLRVKAILLGQGQSPQQLELGDEFYGVDCVALLNQLLQIWCEGSTDRSADRQTVSTPSRVCIGFDTIYSYISGKPIKITASGEKKISTVDTAAFKQIAAIGHTFTESGGMNLEALESWTIENESILGARLLRNSIEGERIGNNQLIALRTQDAKAFMLGAVSWRIVTRSGQLRMGVQYLPGVAQPVVLKFKQAVPGEDDALRSSPALLLPAIPSLKIPASMLIQRDAFLTNRICELVQSNQEKIKIKMGFSVASGVDFERISFSNET